jgi:hypothetical protein
VYWCHVFINLLLVLRASLSEHAAASTAH